MDGLPPGVIFVELSRLLTNFGIKSMITQWHINKLEKKIADLEERVKALEKEKEELIEYIYQKSD